MFKLLHEITSAVILSGKVCSGRQPAAGTHYHTPDRQGMIFSFCLHPTQLVECAAHTLQAVLQVHLFLSRVRCGGLHLHSSLLSTACLVRTNDFAAFQPKTNCSTLVLKFAISI
jgi:hypothetical protein